MNKFKLLVIITIAFFAIVFLFSQLRVFSSFEKKVISEINDKSPYVLTISGDSNWLVLLSLTSSDKNILTVINLETGLREDVNYLEPFEPKIDQSMGEFFETSWRNNTELVLCMPNSDFFNSDFYLLEFKPQNINLRKITDYNVRYNVIDLRSRGARFRPMIRNPGIFNFYEGDTREGLAKLIPEFKIVGKEGDRSTSLFYKGEKVISYGMKFGFPSITYYPFVQKIAVSPDKRYIFYSVGWSNYSSSWSGGFGPYLYCFDVIGKKISKVVDNNFMQYGPSTTKMAWTPDSKKFIYINDVNKQIIEIILQK